jgi:hypothetical protein
VTLTGSSDFHWRLGRLTHQTDNLVTYILLLVTKEAVIAQSV